MIKKMTAVLLSAAMIMSLSSCGKGSSGKDDGKVSIVCTIFPEYDWVKNITKDVDSVEITYLLHSGADLHSYQPTADDMMKISDCDLFIYAGGESDSWVDDALENKLNEDMKIIDMLEVIGDSAKEEEQKEGMMPEEEEEEEEEEGDGKEYDEHIWLSVPNAEKICDRISSDLCEIDDKNKDKYKANLESYKAELDKLDKDIRDVCSAAKEKTLIFGDRFPFRYFTDEYGLDYYAAFAGCSAETEASFETIAFLASKADELGAKTIFTIENSDGKIAQAIIDSTKDKNMSIKVLDSLQSVTGDMLDNGVSYISIMQSNLEVLKAALG